MSALLPSSSFQPVTSRHQLGLATGGVSVGDGLSPTEMERRQPVTDRNRLVTNCNQLTFEIEPIRVYPQIAEPYPQTTAATPSGSNASPLAPMQNALTPSGSRAHGTVGCLTPEGSQPLEQERPKAATTPEGSPPLFRVRDCSGKPGAQRGLAANSPTARIWRRHTQTTSTTNTFNPRTAFDHLII